ncbi:MAG: hypothetical protein IKN15_09155 [Bacteroidaceae bacterium]|nr:hypothetical protein [Bacteroidaceae bacterium]
MKKSYLIMAAIASVALASCSDEQFVGENDPGTGQGNPTVIRFGSLGKGLTRADLTGSAAAEKLGNKFVFFGTKTVPGANSTSTTSKVFDHYNANWATNTAHTTESNSSDWEYVGYTPASTTDLASGAVQSIKYWDYAASQYDFAAYSLGIGATTTENNQNTTTYATASKINFANLGKSVMTTGENPTMNDPVYTLAGSAEALKACYISDLVTAYNQSSVSDYGNVVTFSFRSLAAKIRIAFFETVPGYSVKNIQFYNKAEYTPSTGTFGTDGSADATPKLLTANDQATLPNGAGTMKVYFPTIGFDNRTGSTNAKTDYNKAHVVFANTSANDLSSTLTFNTLANLAAAESKETTGNTYLGRSSNNATYAGGLENNSGKYYTILPNESGANLMLRIKYTLVSTDGSGEEINVDNATAVIPAELAQWQPNYAYTYIFKISDMTNGTTGIDQATNKPSYGLTPITLNAVVVDSEEGVQETITTVSTPSITTYTQGKVVTENDEYVSGNTIYVIVNNGTSNVALNETAKLYTVTQSKVDNTSAANANQPISEESVANAFAFGKKDNDSNPTTWTVTDANKWNLTLTASSLNFGNTIAAADSPTGNEITIGTNEVATFTAGAAGTIYAFQYRKVDANKTTYTAEEANKYNAKIPGAITTSNSYSFTSYAENKTTKYGTGIVKVVSTTGNEWTTVLVLTNTAANNNVSNADSFVGQEFKVNATAFDANTFYQLYTTAGVAQPIYVKVTTSADDVNAYNATLPGAVSTSTINPDAYGYKIIKIQ